MKIKSAARINELLEYSKKQGIRFPTQLKSVQDNITFSQIIIPDGRKNSGNVMTLEETNKFISKSTKGKGQAEEYGHSFERELSYMIVHGFYHLMGYDHIEEEDKIVMRPKEENILNKLGIRRDDELNEE